MAATPTSTCQVHVHVYSNTLMSKSVLNKEKVAQCLPQKLKASLWDSVVDMNYAQMQYKVCTRFLNR